MILSVVSGDHRDWRKRCYFSPKYTKTEKTVIQGYVFSPDLFILFSDAILRDKRSYQDFLSVGTLRIRYVDVFMGDKEKCRTV